MPRVVLLVAGSGLRVTGHDGKLQGCLGQVEAVQDGAGFDVDDVQFFRRGISHVGEAVGANLDHGTGLLPFLRFFPGLHDVNLVDDGAGVRVQDVQLPVVGQNQGFAVRTAGEGTEPVRGSEIHGGDGVGQGVEEADAGGALFLSIRVGFVIPEDDG